MECFTSIFELTYKISANQSEMTELCINKKKKKKKSKEKKERRKRKRKEGHLNVILEGNKNS
jgi:hypothetical protein